MELIGFIPGINSVYKIQDRQECKYHILIQDKIILRRTYIMDLSKVKEVVVEQLGVELSELKPETSLKDDLNADSLDLFQIIMSLEEEFGIEIPTEDTENINTIGDIEAYLEKRR